MNVLFYQRYTNINNSNDLPHHYYYGATELGKYGFNVQYYQDLSNRSRIIRNLVVTFNILVKKKRHDILYCSTANGLELLVILRSLGLYKKPIFAWQHKATKVSNNLLIIKLLKFYYNGFDKMFVFTPLHIEESIINNIVDSNKFTVISWGADSEYYDRLKVEKNSSHNINKFCSTGKENRDFLTLVSAFKSTKFELDVYTTRQHGGMNNERTLLIENTPSPNINIIITDGTPQMAKQTTINILDCFAIVVCCHSHSYTVGLTSIIEAMALGKPIITTYNKYYPFNVEEMGIGLNVRHGDVDGWIRNIEYLVANPHIATKMGERARALVESEYNLTAFSKKIAESMKSVYNK